MIAYKRKILKHQNGNLISMTELTIPSSGRFNQYETYDNQQMAQTALLPDYQEPDSACTINLNIKRAFTPFTAQRAHSGISQQDSLLVDDQNISKFDVSVIENIAEIPN